MGLTSNIKDVDLVSIRQAIAKLGSTKLGPTSSPIFTGMTLTGLDANEFVFTNASKALTSVNVPLTVAYGGTGAATLINHGLLLGSGTDAVTQLAEASNGQLPIGATGADPTLATLTEGDGISVTNGAGSITIATTITQYTDEMAQDAIGGILDDGTVGNIVFTYDDGGDAISAVTQDGEIDHDSLLNVHQDVNISASPTFVNEKLTGYLDLTEISTPDVPVENDIRLYAVADANFTVLETKTDLGIVTRLNQDTFRIARNTSGDTIVKGRAVYFTGSTDNIPNFSLAKADDEATMPAIGVTSADVADGDYGQILIIGRLIGINTSAFAEGTMLYVSPTIAGTPTEVRPEHPNLAQWLGTVEISDATDGTVLIVVQSITGVESGTNRNNFTIGDQTAGAKTLSFDNGNIGTLSWNPTAARTIVLQDGSGTLAFTGDAPTAHLHDGDILECDGIDSDAAAFPFDTGGTVTFNNPIITTSVNSLYLKLVATRNIGIGSSTTLDALDDNPEDNIAIGVGAGSGITNGDVNVFIGTSAGYSKTTSSGCVAIGHEAAYSGSIIGGLTAVGYQAMRYHTGGNGNTAIGYQAGLGAVSGCVYTYNTFVGEASGVSCHQGGSNVCFGKNSGHDLHDGCRNIFLGFSAGYKQADNSDLLIVDNQQRADAATEATNAVLYGVMAALPADQTLAINAATTVSQTFESTGVATLADGSLLKTSAAPTTDAMIANKKYVDDNAGGADSEKVKVDAAATAGYIGAASNDGVLRTGTGLTYTDGGDFVTLTVAGTYVDRGDPAADDYLVGDFTTDDTWRDLDLGPGGAGIIPAGAIAVLLSLGVLDNTANANFQLRKNGNSNAKAISALRTQVANVRNDNTAIVACDANGVIEYKAENVVWTGIWITVMGWWI